MERRSSASDLFGVMSVERGNKSLIRMLRAEEWRSVWPDVETHTGSHTIGGIWEEEGK